MVDEERQDGDADDGQPAPEAHEHLGRRVRITAELGRRVDGGDVAAAEPLGKVALGDRRRRRQGVVPTTEPADEPRVLAVALQRAAGGVDLDDQVPVGRRRRGQGLDAAVRHVQGQEALGADQRACFQRWQPC